MHSIWRLSPKGQIHNRIKDGTLTLIKKKKEEKTKAVFKTTYNRLLLSAACSMYGRMLKWCCFWKVNINNETTSS